jgi:hypothetical protein
MARKKATPDELEARAAANGYQRGTHPGRRQPSRRQQARGQDQEKSRCNVGSLCGALPSDKGGCSSERTSCPRPSRCTGRVLARNVEVPDLATVKDFFRFCTATGKGKIVKKITCDSLVAVAEWFFADQGTSLPTSFQLCSSSMQTSLSSPMPRCNLSLRPTLLYRPTPYIVQRLYFVRRLCV